MHWEQVRRGAAGDSWLSVALNLPCFTATQLTSTFLEHHHQPPPPSPAPPPPSLPPPSRLAEDQRHVASMCSSLYWRNLDYKHLWSSHSQIS
ncbi:hypothetical protein O3P69_010093 [Scylla paramamosain]|uniref:Uncharacterized protein n=1 Tax=Scylla paramamosain TaxID=85552 RepID=A0AAW0SRV3_SCYPA